MSTTVAAKPATKNKRTARPTAARKGPRQDGTQVAKGPVTPQGAQDAEKPPKPPRKFYPRRYDDEDKKRHQVRVKQVDGAWHLLDHGPDGAEVTVDILPLEEREGVAALADDYAEQMRLWASGQRSTHPAPREMGELGAEAEAKAQAEAEAEKAEARAEAEKAKARAKARARAKAETLSPDDLLVTAVRARVREAA